MNKQLKPSAVVLVRSLAAKSREEVLEFVHRCARLVLGEPPLAQFGRLYRSRPCGMLEVRVL